MPGVELLFGPMLIGVMLNVLLYGVVVTQMFVYFERYRNDSPWMRYLMVYLLIVATANVFVEAGIIYQPLILQYGAQESFIFTPKLLPGDSIMIVSTTSGSYIVPAFLALISFTAFGNYPGVLIQVTRIMLNGHPGSGLFVSMMVSKYPQFLDFDKFTTAVTVWLLSSAVCDVVIAIAMSYALWTRKTGFSSVDGQINRIVRLTLETGTLTAVVAIADVSLFQGFPVSCFAVNAGKVKPTYSFQHTSLNFMVDFPLANLYICSILAMLNSRERRKPVDTEHGHGSATVVPTQTLIKSSHPRPSQDAMQVFKTTELVVARDTHTPTPSEVTWVAGRECVDNDSDDSTASSSTRMRTSGSQSRGRETFGRAMTPRQPSLPRASQLELRQKPRGPESESGSSVESESRGRPPRTNATTTRSRNFSVPPGREMRQLVREDRDGIPTAPTSF
ncbi:hypothetical protein FB45DRAFT_1063901 [Roridomyces roridus]|uniref:DUF6534 domain-containing protein n=1 Tax=Roridomyces roridus TaxID=1738132 RepID=A0AAD7FF49_9AGAR|nr:hypothetical protein FB45DRAFT_1063901 [Roridomyces roridus]